MNGAKSQANQTKRKRGRPKLADGAGKRSSFNTRITPHLKERLEQEAAINGRSLSEEIEFRLEQSFMFEQAKFSEFGGEENYKKFRTFAGMADLVSETTGKGWDQDADTWGKYIWLMHETINLTDSHIKPFDIKLPKGDDPKSKKATEFLVSYFNELSTKD